MSLVHLNFESQYLNANTDVNIILPNRPQAQSALEFYTNGKKYPVLWLLHGGGGDYTDWVRKSRIELYAAEENLVVVMPSAQNSNYANYPEFGKGYDFYSYFFEELMPLVYNWFPVSQKKEDNFIAGLSMGGQGALKYAVNRPECFAACAVLSASPKAFPQYYYESVKEKKEKPYVNLINSMGGVENYILSHENIRGTLEKINRDGSYEELPRVLLTIGTKDHQYYYFEDFVAFLKENQFDFEVKKVPEYKHEWRFWDLAIQDALAFFGFAVEKDTRIAAWKAGEDIQKLSEI